jgi:hypothetical protein
MAHKFEVQVEQRMMRQAWNAWFFARGFAWKLPVAMLITLVPVCLDIRAGLLGTTSIIFLTFLGVMTLITVFGYITGLHRAQAKSQALLDGRVSYVFSDATIEGSSALGSIALAWSALAEVRGYRDLVLLGFRGAMYSPLPSVQIPPDALAFLIDRARSAGAKIAGL